MKLYLISNLSVNVVIKAQNGMLDRVGASILASLDRLCWESDIHDFQKGDPLGLIFQHRESLLHGPNI